LPGRVVGECRAVLESWCRGAAGGWLGVDLGRRCQGQAQHQGERRPSEKVVHCSKSSEAPSRQSRSANARATDARAPSGLAWRPQSVRCFVEDAPGRPRGSSEQAQTARGRLLSSLPEETTPSGRCSQAASSSRRPSTRCTCPTARHRRGRAARRDGPAAHPHGRATCGAEPPWPRPSSGVSATIRHAAGAVRLGCPTRPRSRAWPRRPHPERGAAPRAAATTRCESFSRR
jgi:hypothetical protein